MVRQFFISLVFAYSCLAYGASTEDISKPVQPAAATQQAKVASATTAIPVQVSYKWELNDIALVVGLVLSIISLIFSIFNAVVSHRSTDRSRFVNTVTNQRIKWIEQLRQDISTFSGLIHHWVDTKPLEDNENQQILKDIDRLSYVIRLRLNPAGTYDKRIEKILSVIPRNTDNQLLIKENLEELILTSQDLLKEEWEKVKDESKKGPLSDRA